MQPPKRDISHLFNKFAGKEVPMKEEEKVFEGKHVGKHKYTSVTLVDPNDPTIEEMQKVAKDNGLRLRVWFPGSMGTADHRTDRVNARIVKGADGKYRVSGKFNIG